MPGLERVRPGLEIGGSSLLIVIAGLVPAIHGKVGLRVEHADEIDAQPADEASAPVDRRAKPGDDGVGLVRDLGVDLDRRIRSGDDKGRSPSGVSVGQARHNCSSRRIASMRDARWRQDANPA